MHQKGGYVIPLILIFLLVILAGVFIFSQNQVESPALEAPLFEQEPVFEIELDSDDEDLVEDEEEDFLSEEEILLETELDASVILE